ncbi:DUF1127 domain-containing protein [Microvirga roseola]|uniref:DUF1127 domain-containing protein n=1 Tax=Microvirga roseola TaxID=2883126 RepID=UPI001E4FCF20|nr:DUF1127 domain-containing protein [Microvirga roseola]
MNRSANPVMNVPGSSVLGQVTRTVLRFFAALKDRREVLHLAEFDDRMLQDIGLCRSDVDSALSEPLIRTPSAVLVRCAEQHGRTRRAALSVRAGRPVVPVVKRSTLRAS